MIAVTTDLSAYAESFSRRCTNMKIRLEILDERNLVIHLSGALDTENANILKGCIQGLRSMVGNGDTVYIDLHEVPYIASMGIGVLTVFMMDFGKVGINLVLRDLQPGTREIFKMLGILSYFHVEDTSQSS